MPDVKAIADAADMIIAGYAFTKDEDNYIHVLNLNKPQSAAVIFNDEIVSTNMDDIEMVIVKDYYKRNKQYMERENA